MAITKTGESQEFTYTGGMQTFVVPQTGLYMLEVWGAQGGDYGVYDVKSGGLGGYSKGHVILKKGDILYICVGGAGRFYQDGGLSASGYTASGGYNGGGGVIGAQNRYSRSSGGGATHIGTFSGTLAKHGNTDGLYIVAGGGGGASGMDGGNPNGYGKANGGSGGGLNGGNGGISVDGVIANGGGQNPQASGNAAFGAGGTVAGAYAGSGGGGLYGGCSGSQSGSGAGGSGYIGGVPMIKYRGQEYTPETKNGVQSGNGKAAITLVKKAGIDVSIGDIDIIGISVGDTEVDLQVV